MSSPELITEARRWLRFAREDLAGAEGLLANAASVPRHVCWLAQQAAEKALKAGLAPFVEREFKNAYRDRVAAEATRCLGEDRLNAHKPVGQWDVAALLKLMWEAWNEVFRKTLG